MSSFLLEYKSFLPSGWAVKRAAVYTAQSNLRIKVNTHLTGNKLIQFQTFLLNKIDCVNPLVILDQ